MSNSRFWKTESSSRVDSCFPFSLDISLPISSSSVETEDDSMASVVKVTTPINMKTVKYSLQNFILETRCYEILEVGKILSERSPLPSMENTFRSILRL